MSCHRLYCSRPLNCISFLFTRPLDLRIILLLLHTGPQSVRMSWGSAQEAAALYSLMHALPKSRLLEAGLFRVDESRLPPSWCFKRGELPPLGASPDGMLFHTDGLCRNIDVVNAEGIPQVDLSTNVFALSSSCLHWRN